MIKNNFSLNLKLKQVIFFIIILLQRVILKELFSNIFFIYKFIYFYINARKFKYLMIQTLLYITVLIMIVFYLLNLILYLKRLII